MDLLPSLYAEAKPSPLSFLFSLLFLFWDEHYSTTGRLAQSCPLLKRAKMCREGEPNEGLCESLEDRKRVF